MFGDRRLERPFAWVVGDKRDMGGSAWLNKDGVAPIGFPPVIHRVEESRDMTQSRIA